MPHKLRIHTQTLTENAKTGLHKLQNVERYEDFNEFVAREKRAQVSRAYLYIFVLYVF